MPVEHLRLMPREQFSIMKFVNIASFVFFCFNATREIKTDRYSISKFLANFNSVPPLTLKVVEKENRNMK